MRAIEPGDARGGRFHIRAPATQYLRAADPVRCSGPYDWAAGSIGRVALEKAIDRGPIVDGQADKVPDAAMREQYDCRHGRARSSDARRVGFCSVRYHSDPPASRNASRSTTDSWPSVPQIDASQYLDMQSPADQPPAAATAMTNAAADPSGPPHSADKPRDQMLTALLVLRTSLSCCP